MVRSLAFLEDNIEHKADISEAAKRKPEKAFDRCCLLFIQHVKPPNIALLSSYLQYNFIIISFLNYKLGDAYVAQLIK